MVLFNHFLIAARVIQSPEKKRGRSNEDGRQSRATIREEGARARSPTPPEDNRIHGRSVVAVPLSSLNPNDLGLDAEVRTGFQFS